MGSRRVRFRLREIPILERFLFSIRPARSAILSFIALRNTSFGVSRGAPSSASRKPAANPVEKWI
jgi:hypothetical protein